jgi:catechol 2,3-dioxygenase-like lactoylglutathione lyase family enzyme
MARPVEGFDHAVIGVRDLEAARDVWRRLGFVVTPRGRHVGWGTGNYCIMLGRTYIELLGIVNHAEFLNGLDAKLAAGGEGLLSLALATPDAEAARAVLTGRGFALDAVQALGRKLQLPSGDVMPQFRLLHLPPGTLPGIGSFLTEHLTPDMLRQPDWLVHPNGARDLQSALLVADDPPALQERCERLFGAGTCNLTDRTLTAVTGAQALALMPPDEADAVLEDAAAMLSVRVADIGQVALALKANRVPSRLLGEGTLIVEPQHATGVLLEFTEKDL